MSFILKGDGAKPGKEQESVGQKKAPSVDETNVEIPLFKNILDEYISTGSLSQGASIYIKKLREILEDKTNLIKITTKKLPRLENVYLFSSGKFGLILIFNDMAITDLYQIARNELVGEAIKSARMVEPTTQILNAIMLNESDYEKYNQMAVHINKIFKIYETNVVSEFSIKSFSKNESLIIDTNLDNVMKYLEQVSPHGIPARADIGLICYKAIGNVYGNAGMQQNKQPLFAVTAYTEMVPDSITANKVTFTPLVHITDICTPLLFPGILPLVKAVSAEIFGAYRHWQTPYMNIKKGAVNIGNLIIDPKTGKPNKIKTENELQYMFSEHFTPPAIIFDIAEGKARIPALAMYINPSQHGVLDGIFKKFFCSTSSARLEFLGKAPSQKLIGTAKISGLVPGADVVDSRHIDYLNMVNMLGYDDRVAQLFSKYSLDPLQEAELMKTIAGDITFTNLNNEVLLNGQFLTFTVEAISQYVHIINPLTNNIINNIDIRSLLNNTYSSSPSMFTGGYNMPDATNTYNYGFSN